MRAADLRWQESYILCLCDGGIIFFKVLSIISCIIPRSQHFSIQYQQTKNVLLESTDNLTICYLCFDRVSYIMLAIPLFKNLESILRAEKLYFLLLECFKKLLIISGDDFDIQN